MYSGTECVFTFVSFDVIPLWFVSDPEKREVYDRLGKQGLEGGGGSSGNGQGAADIFSAMFGGGVRGRQQPSGPRKGRTVAHKLKVTLEDCYTGKVFKLAVRRQVQKDPEETPQMCEQCGGRGAVLRQRQQGGFIMREQVDCS